MSSDKKDSLIKQITSSPESATVTNRRSHSKLVQNYVQSAPSTARIQPKKQTPLFTVQKSLLSKSPKFIYDATTPLPKKVPAANFTPVSSIKASFTLKGNERGRLSETSQSILIVNRVSKQKSEIQQNLNSQMSDDHNYHSVVTEPIDGFESNYHAESIEEDFDSSQQIKRSQTPSGLVCRPSNRRIAFGPNNSNVTLDIDLTD